MKRSPMTEKGKSIGASRWEQQWIRFGGDPNELGRSDFRHFSAQTGRRKKLIYPRVSFPYLYSSLSLSASFSCPRHHFISSIATFFHVIRTFPGERKPHTFFNLFFFAMQGGALGRTCDLAFNAQYSSRYINRLSSSRLSLTQKRKGLSSKGFERQRPPRNPANRKIRTDSVIPKPT